ncbi:sulfate adenylyltransferase [Vibrio sp. HA2012]|nr:transglutaminase-like cysteine peptidase [Vibrio sp. HA2012]PJC86939.1 sulfate adenylyltransferase [Vibrio sp. HA2012]
MINKGILLVCLLVLSMASVALNSQEQRWIDAVQAAYGGNSGQRVQTWREMIDGLTATSEIDKLTEVNRFFNGMNFVNDIYLWGKKDYWATPLEFLGAYGGDCEDFTISKYFSLLELGVSDQKLRLAYVKAIKLNEFHMVLTYYAKPSSVPLVLDNINPVILPASQRPDLLPIYSFNGQNLWLMKEKTGGKLAGKSSRLSLWNELRSRKDALTLNIPVVNLDEYFEKTK